MASYFEALPKEITEIILLNINNVFDYDNLHKSELVDDILTDKNFWIKNIKLWCPEIDLGAVPQSLLDFDNTLFEIILMNYASALRSYGVVRDILNHHNDLVRSRKESRISVGIYSTISYEWYLHINNFKLLRLNLLNDHIVCDMDSS